MKLHIFSFEFLSNNDTLTRKKTTYRGQMLPHSWIYNMISMKWHIFAHKRLANITMNQKSIEHIALYSLVLVGTLVVGVLARQFVLYKGFDDFSSSVAFFATVIVLMAIYASLQTTFNQFLLPRIEAFLLHFTAFQTMKNYNDTVSVPEDLTIEDSSQATPDVIEPAPTNEGAISEPSEYEVMRTNVIAENNRAIQTKLERCSIILSKPWLPI